MKQILPLLALLAGPAWAASGTLIKDETLRASPSATSASLASVARGSAVEVLAREGGWTQIRAGGRTGWVRILSVRTAASTTSASDLAALTSRREGSQVVAVAGLRGLNEEELKGARFNPQELALLDQYRVNPPQAAAFAQEAGLLARKLPYLPGPTAEFSGQAGAGAASDFWWEDGQ